MADKDVGVWYKDIVIRGKKLKVIREVVIRFNPGVKKSREIGQIIDRIERIIK